MFDAFGTIVPIYLVYLDGASILSSLLAMVTRYLVCPVEPAHLTAGIGPSILSLVFSPVCSAIFLPQSSLFLSQAPVFLPQTAVLLPHITNLGEHRRGSDAG